MNTDLFGRPAPYPIDRLTRSKAMKLTRIYLTNCCSRGTMRIKRKGEKP